jgi:hypothetical protein
LEDLQHNHVVVTLTLLNASQVETEQIEFPQVQVIFPAIDYYLQFTLLILVLNVLHMHLLCVKVICIKPPRDQPHEQRVITILIEQLEEKVNVEEDGGPWGSHVVPVSKKWQQC